MHKKIEFMAWIFKKSPFQIDIICKMSILHSMKIDGSKLAPYHMLSDMYRHWCYPKKIDGL